MTTCAAGGAGVDFTRTAAGEAGAEAERASVASVGGSCDLARLMKGFVLELGVGGRAGFGGRMGALEVEGIGGVSVGESESSMRFASRDWFRECAGESASTSGEGLGGSGGEESCRGGETASSG